MTVAYADRLRDTLPRVRETIATAAVAAGREPATVRLVAVTKGHPAEAVRAALHLGLSDVGENRVEELDGKLAALGREGLRWHMVGHVQGRKARGVVELADLIHSVDSVRLAERLSRAAVDRGRDVAILAQVNTSGEVGKKGLTHEGAEEAVLAMAELPGLSLEGLMTMAPLTDETRVLSSAFARLRELRDRLIARSDRIGGELSMGMTNDLAVAVREGSTMVRVGTALFGERGA